MKIIACIPARLASTRLPNKLLLPLGDYNILCTTYLNTEATGLFDDVIVIADDQSLAESIINIGGKVLMSQQEHATGTDRIAEYIGELDADIIINVQADEPFVNKNILEQIIKCFDDTSVAVATAKYKLDDEIDNPNFVKVVCDQNDMALYFSRSAIPFIRDKNIAITYYKHVGIYAFRKTALQQFVNASPSLIEQAEQLENLRLIVERIPTKVITISEPIIGIDTMGDYEKAKASFE